MKTNLLGRQVRMEDNDVIWGRLADEEGEIVTVRSDSVDILFSDGRVRPEIPFAAFKVVSAQSQSSAEGT